MKKIFFAFFLIILFCTLVFTFSLGVQNINNDYWIGTINTNYLNLRTGTDTSFPSINKLSKNEQVKVYGKIGDWYIIQDSQNQVGVANSQYITLYEESNETEGISENGLSVDENLLFSLINSKREETNLAPLLIDEHLQNLARLKAKDLVDNNCFSHISPTYGTPFEMLKNNSVNYKTASENIAGNSDINKAVESWLNSESHRKNILSNDYNYTGIGIVDSITYGKIIVELFIGK